MRTMLRPGVVNANCGRVELDSTSGRLNSSRSTDRGLSLFIAARLWIAENDYARNSTDLLSLLSLFPFLFFFFLSLPLSSSYLSREFDLILSK